MELHRRDLCAPGVALVITGLLCGCGRAPSVATPQDAPVAAPPAAVEPATAAAPEVVANTDPSAPAPVQPAARLTVPSGQEPAAQAAGTRLGIGDPAPPLKVERWFTGKPLAGIEPGQVQVVEFWATWCGPCLASMPHISELQRHYGDQVRFIGVTREEAGVVESFLAKSRPDGKTWRDEISYRLVQDDGSEMNTTYMKAAGQNGIPCAFIVGRDGVVEWIGHPMRIDQPLASVVAGSWDRAAAIADANRQSSLKQLTSSLSGLMRKQQWDEALKVITDTEQELGPTPSLTRAKLSILQLAGRKDEANVVQAALVEQAWGDADMLNAVAWSIATAKDAEGRDLPLALKAAERANDLRQSHDAAILDTLARVYDELGRVDEAIRIQRQAVEQGGGRATYAATLKEYEDRKSAASAEANAASPAATDAP